MEASARAFLLDKDKRCPKKDRHNWIMCQGLGPSQGPPSRLALEAELAEFWRSISEEPRSCLCESSRFANLGKDKLPAGLFRFLQSVRVCGARLAIALLVEKSLMEILGCK